MMRVVDTEIVAEGSGGSIRTHVGGSVFDIYRLMQIAYFRWHFLSGHLAHEGFVVGSSVTAWGSLQ